MVGPVIEEKMQKFIVSRYKYHDAQESLINE